MDFLKYIAIPQSLEHFLLLRVFLNIVLALSLPYLGIVTGTMILSLYYDRRGRVKGDALASRFANDLIQTFVPGKSYLAYLAVLPVLSVAFLFAQMFQNTPAMTVSLATWAFIFLLIAAVFIYLYRYTTHLQTVFLSQEEAGKTMQEFSASNESTRRKAGKWGLFMLFIAWFFLAAGLTLAADPKAWNTTVTIFPMLLSGGAWIRLVFFLLYGLAITASAVPVYFLVWKVRAMGVDAEYHGFIVRQSERIAFPALLIMPIIVILTILSLPDVALRGSSMLLAGLSIVLMLAAGQFFYTMDREKNYSYAIGAFLAMIVVGIAMGTSDQIAIGSASRNHAAVLAVLYEKDAEEFKAKMGVAGVALTGQEIYDAKCSACHQFDQVKVGPAYREVLPKYQDAKQKLVAFILNPTKIDPRYPPMPAQGLKPAEADSIATFLLKKYAPAPAGS